FAAVDDRKRRHHHDGVRNDQEIDPALAECEMRHGCTIKKKPPVVAHGRLLSLMREFYSAAGVSAAALASFAFLERSSPVTWSTCFIDRRTLPRSSKPSSLTFTCWPSLTTSDGLLTRCGASSDTCTRPSLGPKKFTKAPKSMTLTILPS